MALEELAAIPKTELHQHVDGSIPLDLSWDLMQSYGLSPARSREELERLLVLQEDEQGSLLAYLDKFHYPLWITQFYENIQRVTEAIIADAHDRCGVRVLELRYSPVIHTYAGLTLRQAIRAVLSGINRAVAERPGLEAGLVVIAMRHMGPHIAKILARSAIAEAQRLHRRAGVVGFDIAGAERNNPPGLFQEAYEIARLGGLYLTAHAGEDEGPERVWEAVDELGVHRVGHGCSATRDSELMRRLARDAILVECCLTSNYQTGASEHGEPHPIYEFLEAGVPVAICTDNTTVSDTDQIRENELLLDTLGIPEIERIHRESRQHTFIRPDERLQGEAPPYREPTTDEPPPGAPELPAAEEGE